jgi:hypothetical protein
LNGAQTSLKQGDIPGCDHWILGGANDVGMYVCGVQQTAQAELNQTQVLLIVVTELHLVG